MKRKTTLILFLIFGTIAAAQQRVPPCDVVIPTTIDARYKGYDTVAFKVMNETAPVSDAPVRIYKARKLVLSLTTDKMGMFSLRNIPPGDYTLSVGGWGKATVRIAPLSKVKWVVDEFTLFTPKQHGCPTFVGGID